MLTRGCGGETPPRQPAGLLDCAQGSAGATFLDAAFPGLTAKGHLYHGAGTENKKASLSDA